MFVNAAWKVTWLTCESITVYKITGKGVFLNTGQGNVLTHVYGMNECNCRTKRVLFDSLKCDVKHGHLSQLAK